MTQQNQTYKCNVCGNIVGVLHAASGTLVCCGQPMELLKAKTQEEGNEKHLPVITKTDSGIKVTVGSVAHPMEQDHYIAWIEIITDNKIYRKFLKPGDQPEAEFSITADNIQAREYCNLHGLWQT